ncbi:MAG TPA: OmpA family protein [Rudaea sp.]|nr:OmpA family protein [Rudaea sp.]
MKRNTLFVLIALGLGGVGVANAQDASSWYLAPRLGVVAPDNARTTKTSLFAGIGAGVWVNPNLAVDFEYGINNADFKNSSPRAGHQWESVQFDVAARWFFGEIGSGWRPYVMGGIGAQRHKAYSGFLLSNLGYESGGGWDPMVTAGVGMQYNMSDRLAFRGEIAARYDRDNNSLNTSMAAADGFNRQSGFTDGIVTVGLTYNFGGGSAPAPAPKHEQAAAPAEAPPPAREEATPPAAVSIDLRGVEFKFDHPRVGEKLVPSLKAPTSDSVQILDEAVDTLKRYPNVHVSVDGYTDSVGSDAYNQKLSERRAKGVYNYLTEHGVDASRLDGPKGFGEASPIDTNKTSAGRQRNRRVELKVESQ